MCNVDVMSMNRKSVMRKIFLIQERMIHAEIISVHMDNSATAIQECFFIIKIKKIVLLCVRNCGIGVTSLNKSQ